MHPFDEESTAFVTPKGTYCYRAMPFGLKNGGATYQRLVNKIFKDLIGKTVKCYVDDMIVKIKKSRDHIADLNEAFERLRRFSMKLNPVKCAFEVRSGKFLGFLVSKRGIDANPDKVAALENMKSPSFIKEVQRLTGRLVALSWLISRLADKGLPILLQSSEKSQEIRMDLEM